MTNSTSDFILRDSINQNADDICMNEYEQEPLINILSDEAQFFDYVLNYEMEFFQYCCDSLEYTTHKELIVSYLETYISNNIVSDGMENFCAHLLSGHSDCLIINDINEQHYPEINRLINSYLNENNSHLLLNLFIICPNFLNAFKFEGIYINNARKLINNSFIGKLISYCSNDNTYQANDYRINNIISKLEILADNNKFMYHFTNWVIALLNASLAKYNVDFRNNIGEYNRVVSNSYLFTCYLLYSRIVIPRLLTTSIDKIYVKYITDENCKIRWYQKTSGTEIKCNIETIMFFTLLNFSRIFNCKVINDYAGLISLIRQREELLNTNIGILMHNSLKKEVHSMKVILYDIVRIIKFILEHDNKFIKFYEYVAQVIISKNTEINYDEIIDDFLTCMKLFGLGNKYISDAETQNGTCNLNVNNNYANQNDLQNEDDEEGENEEGENEEGENEEEENDHNTVEQQVPLDCDDDEEEENEDEDYDFDMNRDEVEAMTISNTINNSNNTNIMNSLSNFLQCETSKIKYHMPSIKLSHTNNYLPQIFYKILHMIGTKEIPVNINLIVASLHTRLNLLSIEVVAFDDDTNIEHELNLVIDAFVKNYNSLGDMLIYSNGELYRELEDILKADFLHEGTRYGFKSNYIWLNYFSKSNMDKDPNNKETMLKFLNKYGMYTTCINDQIIKSIIQNKKLLHIAANVFTMFSREMQVIYKLINVDNPELMQDSIIVDVFMCVANTILGLVEQDEYNAFDLMTSHKDYRTICFHKIYLSERLLRFYYKILQDNPNNIYKLKNFKSTYYTFETFIKFLSDANELELLFDCEFELEKREYIDSLIKKLESSDETEEVEIPDKFLDPLTCDLIMTPILLPGVDRDSHPSDGCEEESMFFEKNNIVKHLLSKEENPYTREKLTLKDLDDYNKQLHVMEKIKKFTEELTNWKLTNLKKSSVTGKSSEQIQTEFEEEKNKRFALQVEMIKSKGSNTISSEEIEAMFDEDICDDQEDICDDEEDKTKEEDETRDEYEDEDVDIDADVEETEIAMVSKIFNKSKISKKTKAKSKNDSKDKPVKSRKLSKKNVIKEPKTTSSKVKKQSKTKVQDETNTLKETKVLKKSKEPKKSNEPKKTKESKKPKEPKETKESKGSKETKESKGTKETKETNKSKKSKELKESKRTEIKTSTKKQLTKKSSS